MKNVLSQRLMAVLVTIFLSANVYSLQSKINPANDPELKLNLTISYNIKVVQVALDATDGDTGSFQITKSDGTVVQQLEVVELIKSPNYFTINVTDFSEGDYIFRITGKTRTFTSSIHIK